MLKRTTRATEQYLQRNIQKGSLEMQTNQDRKTEAQLLTYSRDSAWNAYTIKLWPKGKIDYNEGAGFNGEFDSILVTGNEKKMGVAASQSTVKDNINKEVNINQKIDESSKIIDKKLKVERIPDLILVVILLIVMFLGVLYVNKKLKS